MPRAKEHILNTDPSRKPKKDLTGHKIYRWEVLSYAGREKWNDFWNCRCECGIEMIVDGGNLRTEATKSCGCLKIELSGKRITHGMSRRNGRAPEYGIWSNIIQRCTNPNNPKFQKDYGGRGITVCDRWRFGEGGKSGFECFYADMGPRPSPELTCGRGENNDGYCPENCTWETDPEQVSNKRNNVHVTYKGETLCRHEMAAKYGIKYFTLRSRLKAGMTPEEAIETPIFGGKKIMKAKQRKDVLAATLQATVYPTHQSPHQ